MDRGDGCLLNICAAARETVVGEWVFEFAYFLNKNPYYIDERYSSRRVWKLDAGPRKKQCPGRKGTVTGLIGTEDKELLRLLCETSLTGENPGHLYDRDFPLCIQCRGKEKLTTSARFYQRTTERDFARQLDRCP